MEPGEEPYQRIRQALEAEDKRNVALQDLPKTFFKDAQAYLETLGDEVRASLERDPNAPEVLRMYQELHQARESLNKLVDRRMQKVLDLARRAVRPSAQLEPDHLLPAEETLFDSVVEDLRDAREELLGLSRAQHQTLLVMEDLPPVTGTDLRVYRLQEGDVVVVPQDMAEVLVGRGAARPLAMPGKRKA